MRRDDFDTMMEVAIRIANGFASARGERPIKLENYERQVDLEGYDVIKITVSGLEDEIDK